MIRLMRETVIMGRDWWRGMGDRLVKLIRLQTAAGKGADGQAFPAYTDEYRDRKVAGVARGKTKRGLGRAQASRSSRPDLVLTGQMMQDLQTLEATDTSVKVGWPVQGAKVIWNEETGRAITTEEDPLAAPVWSYFERLLDNEIDRRLREAAKSEKLRIKV